VVGRAIRMTELIREPYTKSIDRSAFHELNVRTVVSCIEIARERKITIETDAQVRESSVRISVGRRPMVRCLGV